ncbi:GLPGLI family protein [Marixanthomonas ophiurae]|uniref:GLPGLI family protein n=1 Tax=Marixanthomonas ophiurae TaxID=387659 RepID=A0A3E1QAB2_9FLAO|nr:GLPGLI family protein [Marixanthomonas ophiurae]RFN59075.1 GLPGLI family protein [Marixanthomonas ophiurae]
MKYLYVTLLLLFCVTTFSQTGKITYTSTLNFSGSPLTQGKNNLYFTKQGSLYKSEKDDKPKKKNINKNNDPNVEEIHIGIESDSLGNLYYYDLTTRNFTIREALFENFKMKFYVYEDKGPKQIAWKLEGKFKTISGYNCQKAIGDFRGRSYEAWFTPEIALPYGPWKFVGLPGLILEVYDLKKEVYFAAEDIKIPFKQANTWVKKPSDDPKISHKEFITAKHDVTNKIVKALKARMPKDHKMTSVKTIKSDIELEYEWEKE